MLYTLERGDLHFTTFRLNALLCSKLLSFNFRVISAEMIMRSKLFSFSFSVIISWNDPMKTTNQLLRFYTLLSLRIQCFISSVLFIVNLVISLLLMILSYTLFPVLFKRYSYSALDYAIPMNRCLIRQHGDNKLDRTSNNGNLRFLQLLKCNNLFIGKVLIFKDDG